MCTCSHTTHVAYHPFAVESLGSWTPWLCHVFTYLLAFICWVPQIMLTLPQVHKSGHFLQSEGLKTCTLSAVCCCPSFFLFHRRAVRFQPIRCKVHWTWRIVPRACRAKLLGPGTQLRCSLSNCPNQVHEVKLCPVQNKLSLPNFFQDRQTSWARFMTQMFTQLRT